MNPRDKTTMVKTKGAKSVPKQRCKTIHDMFCIGVCVKDIALYYNMKQPTVSNIIRRLRTSNTKPVKKRWVGNPNCLQEE